MAIALVTDSGAKLYGGSVTSRTFSFTPGNGSTYLLVFTVSEAGDPNTQTVTFNLVSMTEIAGYTSGTHFVGIFGLPITPAGAQDVTITHTNGVGWIIARFMALSGVNTSDPYGTEVVGTKTSAASPLTMSSIPCAVGDWIVSHMLSFSDLAIDDGTGQDNLLDHDTGTYHHGWPTSICITCWTCGLSAWCDRNNKDAAG